MYDYLVVGAGLFGSTFAHEMRKCGKSCIVIDKRTHLGGNIYTEEIDGIQVHRYGAHIFHTSDRQVWEYVNGLTPFMPFINSPMANCGGRLYNLPFNMNTFYQLWGAVTPEQARKKIESQRLKLDRTPANLEEQALSLVGKDIYETLIKGYTEKQWGRPCHELSASIIKRIPMRFTFDNNYFTDRYQGIPEQGYTVLIEQMLTDTEVLLGEEYLENRTEWDKKAVRVLYTGAIDAFYDYCFGELEYRSLRFETELRNERNHQGNAVINYPSVADPFTRIIEHKHFERGNSSEQTVVTHEYPEEWHVGMEAYYPVSGTKNQELYQRYHEKGLQEKQVIFGGRLGLYQYLDMDKVIAKALQLVEMERVYEG